MEVGGGWKMIFLYNWVIFRFQQLIFQGETNPSLPMADPARSKRRLCDGQGSYQNQDKKSWLPYVSLAFVDAFIKRLLGMHECPMFFSNISRTYFWCRFSSTDFGIFFELTHVFSNLWSAFMNVESISLMGSAPGFIILKEALCFTIPWTWRQQIYINCHMNGQSKVARA